MFLLRNNREQCLSANFETAVVETMPCKDALHWSVNEGFEDMKPISPSDNEELCVSDIGDGELQLAYCDTEDW